MQVQNHVAPLEEKLENQGELAVSATGGTYFGEKDTHLVPFWSIFHFISLLFQNIPPNAKN